jgi:hypothetical protein
VAARDQAAPGAVYHRAGGWVRGAVQRARGRGGGQGRAVPSAAGGARPVGAVCSVRQMQGGRQHGRRRVGSGRGERSTWPPRRAGRMAQGTGARGRAVGGWGPGQYRARRAGRGGPEDRRAMGSTGGRRMGGGLRGTADTGGQRFRRGPGDGRARDSTRRGGWMPRPECGGCRAAGGAGCGGQGQCARWAARGEGGRGGGLGAADTGVRGMAFGAGGQFVSGGVLISRE